MSKRSHRGRSAHKRFTSFANTLFYDYTGPSKCKKHKLTEQEIEEYTKNTQTAIKIQDLYYPIPIPKNDNESRVLY